MEYVYATLLLHSAGKEISEDNIRKVLLSAGIEVDEIRLKSLVAAIKQINIDEIIKTAALAPTTVAITPSQPQAQAQAQQAKPQAKEEEKKEEKKEVTEEELEQGLSALFG
ncbi:MAG: 50S ribosomal protein P1 [Sulfolobales archaeon]